MTEEVLTEWTPENWDNILRTYSAICIEPMSIHNSEYTDAAYTQLVRLYRLGKKIDPSIRLP